MIRKVFIGIILVVSNAFAQTNTLDPTQVYTTQNITNNTTNPTNTTGTWQNVGLWNQGLPCWAPGGPVYCGPQPYFNNGSFNFSYGLTDVYQIVNIANALPNSGTGLRVNGYNFTFMAKNGNGWDNGQTDYLSAYVNFFGKNGQSVRYDYYDLNYKFDWTQFGWSKTFDTPFASKNLSTVQYGFIGGDSNFWAGPYGPEITNIGFSLKYSVDPCFNNPLYSSTCPGYLEALAKLNPQSTTTTTDPIASTATSPGVTTTTTVTADTTNPTVTVVSTPIQPTTQSTMTTAQVANSTSSSSNVNSSSGTSIGLSVVARNREREQAIVSQTVQNALSISANAANDSQKEALSVSSQSSQNSQTFASTQRSTESKESNTNHGNVSVMSTQNSSTTVLNLLVGPQTTASNINNQQNQSIVSTNIVNVTRPSQTTQTQEINNNVSSSAFSLLPENRQVNTTTQTIQNIEENKTNYSLYRPNVISATNEVQSFVSQNFLTDRTNPLNQVTENRIAIPETNVARTGPTVNRDVTNNELAGGVDINRMALAPVGYNDYLNMTLRDAAFYAPKEIYRNQRVIDNARALRQLSSDRLHQEMVEQQYRR